MKQRPTKIRDELLPNKIDLLDTYIPPLGCSQALMLPVIRIVAF